MDPHERWAGRPARRGRALEPSTRTRPSRRSARLTGLVMIGAVLAGGVLLLRSSDDDLGGLTDIFRPRAYVHVDGRAVAVPRPADSGGRILPAVPVTTAGSHAFLHVDEAGGPVGYDPCRPVRYVVRPDGAPDQASALLADAIAVVEQSAGVRFEQLGTTDEPPVEDRPLIQPERYGDGWAPVLVAWADETEVAELAGQVAGVGGSAAVPGADGRGQWLAAGRVVLDTDDIAGLLARHDGYAQARGIVVHELAHVLGLDHVDDPTELMHPMTSTRADLGPGDRQGLALVGQVACEQ